MPRTFSKSSPTYQLFEKKMLDFHPDGIPSITGISKGKAVNLAMGLNVCQMQWWREQINMPETMLTISAKAKPSEDGTWYVEFSRNERRQGRLTPGSQWIRNLLKPKEMQEVQEAHMPPPTRPAQSSVYDRMLTGAHISLEPEPAAEEPATTTPKANATPGAIPAGYVKVGDGLREAVPLIKALREGLQMSGGITEEDVVEALHNGTGVVRMRSGKE